MPIPVPPEKNELGECIRFLRREKPEMSSDQRVAVCLDVYRRAHGKKDKERD